MRMYSQVLELLLLSSAAVGVLLNTKHTGKFCKRKQAKENVSLFKKKKSLQLMLYDGMYGFSLKTSYVATSLYLKQIKYVNMF